MNTRNPNKNSEIKSSFKSFDSLNGKRNLEIVLMNEYDLCGFEAKEISGGLVSNSYDISCGGERFYLKRFCDRHLNKVELIHRYMIALAECGFPVAKPCIKKNIQKFPDYWLYNFVEGLRIDYLTGNGIHFYDLGRNLGLLLDASRKIYLEGEEEQSSKLKQLSVFEDWAYDCKLFGSQIRCWLKELVEILSIVKNSIGERNEQCFCHGDFSLGNVLFDSASRINLISDFDECGTRPVIHEVAITIARSCFSIDPKSFLIRPGKMKLFLMTFMDGIKESNLSVYTMILNRPSVLTSFILLETLNGIWWRLQLALTIPSKSYDMNNIIKDRLEICLWLRSNFSLYLDCTDR